MSVITRAGGLLLCYFLLTAGNLVVSANITRAADYEHVIRIVNQTFYYCILFTAVISIVHLAKDIRHLVSSGPAGAPARST
jgi:hypothetical protein